MKTLKGLPIYYKYIWSSFHVGMAQHEIQGVHLVHQGKKKYDEESLSFTKCAWNVGIMSTPNLHGINKDKLILHLRGLFTNLKVGMGLTYNIMKILFLKPYEWNVHRDKIKTLMSNGVKQIVTLVCGTRIWNTSLVRKGCPNILWSKTSSFSIVRLLRVPNTYNSIWMGKL